MVTKEDLETLGFKNELNPFSGKYEWTIGEMHGEISGTSFKTPVVYYDIGIQHCKTGMSEFTLIGRVCETVDEIKKFIECINFLFHTAVEIKN